MSRVAKKPITLGKVELNVQSDSVTVKGPKGTLSLAKPAGVAINVDNGVATLSTENAELVALTGTVRAILSNMVKGVSEGFERKLELVGGLPRCHAGQGPEPVAGLLAPGRVRGAGRHHDHHPDPDRDPGPGR
jgi:ribosomal protein L6P/L9E